MIARNPDEAAHASVHLASGGGRKPLFIDLFAGAGGFSLGLTSAGFECLGAIERDQRASETYRLNFPEHVVAPLSRMGPRDGDVTKLQKDEVLSALRALKHPDVSLLVGGPPCQGFSRVGRGKLDSLSERGGFHRDPRNRLYQRYMDVLQWVRPKAFIFENVVGILHVRGVNVAELVCLDAEALGYKVRCAVLNAAWYGVPQSRERVFIIGVRDDLGMDPVFPKPHCRLPAVRGAFAGKGLSSTAFSRPDFLARVLPREDAPPPVTAREAIGDLPPVPNHGLDAPPFISRQLREPVPYRRGRPSEYAREMRGWDPDNPSRLVHDHTCRHNPRDYRIFARMQPRDCYPEAVQIAEALWAEARGNGTPSAPRSLFVPPYSLEGFDEKWQMLDPDQPSWTVTAHLSKDCYSHIHYDARQSRTISIREAARLQSFPDSFLFCGGMGDRFRQIGNAVPPLVAFSLGENLSSQLGATSETTRRV